MKILVSMRNALLLFRYAVLKPNPALILLPLTRGEGGKAGSVVTLVLIPPPPPPPSPLVRRVICAVLACIVRQGGFNPEVQPMVLSPPPYDGPYYKS